MAKYKIQKPWGPLPVPLLLIMLFLVHSSRGLPEEKSNKGPHRYFNTDKTSNGDNKKRDIVPEMPPQQPHLEIGPEIPPEQPHSPTKASFRLRRSPLELMSGSEGIRNQRKDSGSKRKGSGSKRKDSGDKTKILTLLVPSTRRKRAVAKDVSSPEPQFYTPSPFLAHLIKERVASKQGQSGKHLCPLLRRQKIREPPPRQGRNVRHRFTNPDAAASNPENEPRDRRPSRQEGHPASPLMLEIPVIRRHRAVRRDVLGIVSH